MALGCLRRNNYPCPVVGREIADPDAHQVAQGQQAGFQQRNTDTPDNRYSAQPPAGRPEWVRSAMPRNTALVGQKAASMSSDQEEDPGQ